MICPNVNSSDWKRLVSQVGEEAAWAIFAANQKIPVYAYSVEEVSKDFGLDEMTSALDKSVEIRQKYDNVFATAVKTEDGKYLHVIELTSMPMYTNEFIDEEPNVDYSDVETEAEELFLEEAEPIITTPFSNNLQFAKPSQDYIRGYSSKTAIGKELGLYRKEVSFQQRRNAQKQLGKFNTRNNRKLDIVFTQVGQADLYTWEIVDKDPMGQYTMQFQKQMSQKVKEGVLEVFESNPELANKVYETLGFTPIQSLINSSENTLELSNKLLELTEDVFLKDSLKKLIPYIKNNSNIEFTALRTIGAGEALYTGQFTVLPNSHRNLQDFIKTYIHELYHVISLNELLNNEEFNSHITKLREEAIDKLGLNKEAFKKLKNIDFGVSISNLYYGLLNNQEFISELFTNKEFSNKLDTIKISQNKSLIDKIFDLINRLINKTSTSEKLKKFILNNIQNKINFDRSEVNLEVSKNMQEAARASDFAFIPDTQQKQQALQLYSQYVAQTGKQDIEGFKNYVQSSSQLQLKEPSLGSQNVVNSQVQAFFDQILEKFPMLQIEHISVEQAQEMYNQEKITLTQPITVLTATGALTGNQKILLPKTLTALQAKYPGMSFKVSENQVVVSYKGSTTKGQLATTIAALQQELSQMESLQAKNLEITTSNPFAQDMSKIPAFYFNNTVYVVSENITIDTAVHEVLHPFVDAFAAKNPGDFYTLMSSIMESGDPVIQDIVMEVQDLYQDVNPFTMQKEIMVRVLTPTAVKRYDKLTEAKSPVQRLVSAINEFINSILNAFRSPNNRSTPIKNITDKRLSEVLYQIFAEESVFDNTTVEGIQAFKETSEETAGEEESKRLRGYGRARNNKKGVSRQETLGKSRDIILEEIFQKSDLIKPDTFSEDELKGNRYVLADGTPVELRPTDFTKKLFKGKNLDDLSLAEVGTIAHAWMQYYMYEDIMSREGRGLIEYKGKKIPEKPKTSEAFSQDILKEIKIVAALLVKDIENIQKEKNDAKYKRLQKNAGPGETIPAVNDKAWLLLEMSLYVDKFVDGKDIAGTMDMMVMYSDNAIDVLDHKFMQARFSKMYTEELGEHYKHNPEVHPIKRKSAEIQMNIYKSMLIKGYGVSAEQFNRVRIIPYQLEFRKTFKAKYSVKNARGIYTMANTEGLGMIVAIRERVQNKELDYLIKTLYDRKAALRESFKSIPYDSPNFDKIGAEMNLIDKAIDEIILYHTVTGIAEAIINVSKHVNKNLEKMNLGEMSQAAAELETYQKTLLMAQEAMTLVSNQVDQVQVVQGEEINVTKTLRDYFKEAQEEDSGVVMSSIAKRIIDGSLSNQEVLNIVNQNNEHIGKAINYSSSSLAFLHEEMLNILSEKNPAVLETVKDRVTNIASGLATFSEIDNPLFEIAAEEIKFANSSIENDHAVFLQEALDQRNALEKWAKENGMSLNEAYSKIYNPVTGKLIRKWDKDALRRVKEADEKGDTEFFKTYYKLKDNYQELYEAEKKRMLAIFDRRYGQGSEEYNIRVNEWLQTNNMNNYEAWTKRFSRMRYLELKEPDKYLDAEYLALGEGLKTYYDWYVKTNSKFNDMVPEFIGEGMVANIKKDATEIYNLLTSGNFKKAAEISGKLLSDSLKIKAGRNINMIDPTSLHNIDIPLLYYDNFEYWDETMGEYRANFTKNPGSIEKSEDLTYNIIMFSRAVITKHHMENIKDTVVAAGALLRHQQIYQTDRLGRIQTQDKIPIVTKNSEAVIQLYNELVLMHLGGHTVTNQDQIFKVFGISVSSNKALSILYNAIRVMALGFNYVVGFAGGITGYANIYIHSKKRKYFTFEQWIAAQAQFFNPADYKANTAIADYWKIERENQGFRAGLETKSWLRRNIFNSNVFYKVFQIPEEANSNILLFSMSRNFGIDPKNPNRVDRLEFLPKGTKSIHELLKIEEGKNQAVKISYEGLNARAFADFRMKVKRVSSSIKGTYTSEDMDAFQGNMYMRSLLMFRRWIKPNVQSRFGELRYDPGLGEYEVGRIRVLTGELFGELYVREQGFKTKFANFIGKTLLLSLRAAVPFSSRVIKKSTTDKLAEMYYEKYIQNNPDHAKDPNNPDKPYLSLDHFKEIREQEITAFITELRVLAMLKLLIMMLAGGIGADDEDEALYKENGFLNVGYKMLKRARLEMLFFYNPVDFKAILQSPIPAMSFFENVFNFLGNSFDETRDFIVGENELTKKGLSKDRTERGYYFYRFIPGVKHIQRTIDDMTEHIIQQERKKSKLDITELETAKPMWERKWLFTE